MCVICLRLCVLILWCYIRFAVSWIAKRCQVMFHSSQIQVCSGVSKIQYIIVYGSTFLISCCCCIGYNCFKFSKLNCILKVLTIFNLILELMKCFSFKIVIFRISKTVVCHWLTIFFFFLIGIAQVKNGFKSII